jgi:hypothetical protein
MHESVSRTSTVLPFYVKLDVRSITNSQGKRAIAVVISSTIPLDPGAVIRPVPGEWHPHMPAQLDDEELADWRAGRAAVYQLAALTIGGRIVVAEA